MKRPAAFLDRDGVLNHDTGYVYRPAAFVWVEGAREAVGRLNRAGYWVFVVTNQAGVGRGLYGENDVRALHSHMQAELAQAAARIDAFRFCPHHPEAELAAYRHTCQWRKPGPGMLLDLFRHYPVELDGSFLIGDRQSDLEAARAAGVRGIHFGGGSLDAFVSRVIEAAPEPEGST